jgi:fluoride exporter
MPYGTLSVNLLGCLLLGLVMRHHGQDSWKLLAATGFIGAFTTFSTLKLESIRMLKQNEWGNWLIYTFLTYTFGILFVSIGYYM